MLNAEMVMRQRGGQLTGADQALSAEQLRAREEKRSNWPYEHIFPPPSSDTVNQISSGVLAVVPPIGSTVVTLAYRVPSGSRFFLMGIIQNVYGASGGPLAMSPGDITWTVDKNRPVGIGDTQGMGIQGLINVPIPLGSFPFGVIWRFSRAYEFEPLDLIQSKATNVASGNVGAPNTFVSAFIGYRLPVLDRIR